jgi:serine/threonine protein kinase
VALSPTQTWTIPKYWPSARYFTEAIQCPSVCFAHPVLRTTLPAVDRLGMPLVTSGQFAYVYKLKSTNGAGDFAVRCFRGYLGDRDQRYRAIQEHLWGSPVFYLSEFSYASEGILVGGNRFPILFMKWIDGPTLDLYISEMIHRRDVLLHLSEEWLRLLHALHASGIAHGDLQHGNIIVEHGQLRLVDHDGIFVPKMSGWTASEVGHQHFQHPRREAHHFDEKLDRFSSLVIYLSLLALAEQPSLWQEYHDENLLFTKTDFADPESSTLFRKIREIGPEHARLADALAGAAVGPPDEVPSLLDLVKTKTSLPAWMTAPTDLEARTKTREVAAPPLPPDSRTIRWIPWQEKNRFSTNVPATPSSSTVQTLFGGAGKAPVVLKDPQDILRNTFTFSREFLRSYFILFLAWDWGAYLLLKFVGFGFFISLFVGMFCLAIACLTFGVVKAVEESRKPVRLSGLPAWQHPSISAPPPNPQTLSWNVQPLPPPASSAVTAADPLVGNMVLGIFHLENCNWVNSISLKNRVGFSTVAEAQSHGFKPCHICSPAM